MKHSRLFWLAAASVVLALPLSCGDDEDDKDPVAPLPPASLSISGFIGAASERFAPDASELTVDCTGELAVELAIEGWTLLPPGGCGSRPQCGHVALIVDEGTTIEAITRTVVVPLGAEASGLHELRAELRLDDHSPFVGETGAPVSDAVSIEVAQLACPDGSNGGAGGAAGSGGASGEGGSAGAGGSAEGGTGGASAGGAGGAGGESAQGGAAGAGGGA